MKKIYVALAVMGIIVLLVLAVGFLLPEDHTAASRATYRADPDQVWSVLSDLAGAPTWRDGVDRMERLDGAEEEVWREQGRYGAMTYAVERHPDDRRLVMRLVGEAAFGGSWTYRVDENPGGSTLTITEDGAIYNPVFRVVARFLMGYHATMDDYLQALGSRLGESVQPVHVPPEN